MTGLAHKSNNAHYQDFYGMVLRPQWFIILHILPFPSINGVNNCVGIGSW